MSIVLEKHSTFVDVGCHKGEVLSKAMKIEVGPKPNFWGWNGSGIGLGELLAGRSESEFWDLSFYNDPGVIFYGLYWNSMIFIDCIRTLWIL